MSQSDKFAEYNQEGALRQMLVEAERLGVKHGVAVVLILGDNDKYHKLSFSIFNNFERDPEAERGALDRGTNYLGVVMAKVARMMSLHADSGFPDLPVKVGELPYRGGLTCRIIGGRVFTAFSGGTEDEDVQIALQGMRTMDLAV